MTFRSLLPALLIAVAVCAADQFTKHVILSLFAYGDRVSVVPGFFDLTLTYNPGAAFGLLAGIRDDVVRLLLLGVSTAGALGVVVYFFLTDYADDPPARAALAAVVGGAAGNVIDRVRFGAVVDFLDFYVSGAHWPTFNVADSAICVGVAVLLVRGAWTKNGARDRT